jgi:hypothetical protein
LLQDLGFVAFTLPDVAILMPMKKPRGQVLTLDQQRANRSLNERRLRIEHVNIVIAHPQRGTVNLLKKRQKRLKRHRGTLLALVCSALSITSAPGRECHPKPTAQV